MKTRFTALFLSLGTLAVLAAVSNGRDKDAKPVTKAIRSGDGTPIVCEIRGKGDTALIFLHGWCGDREYWKNQVDVFAPDYTVVTLDQAGHGESGKDRKEWTVDSLASDVSNVIKELGLKRVILVGHSMGGPVALATVPSRRNEIVAVIGVDTLQNAEMKAPEEQSKKFLEMFTKDFKGTLEGGMPSLVGDKADADLKKWLTTRAVAQDPKMALALMRDMQSLDATKLLKEAKVPVRCINSSGGFKFHTPTDIKANKKYADFDAVMIADVGHYPMLEKPAEFNEKLRTVLKEFAPKK
jgi:pimeloyl-ACP methyl ester carboxylesterase